MIISLPNFREVSNLRPVAIECAMGFDISPDRIDGSSGTRSVTSAEIEEFGYANEAIIPMEPWVALRGITTQPVSYERKPTDWSRTIGLLQLPFSLNESIRSALMSKHSSLISNAFIKEISEICEIDDPVWIGGGSNPPNQKTVTVDRRSGNRIGMHVDSWDEAAILERRHCTNRVCFNLGAEPRYLLFAPFALTDIYIFLQRQNLVEREHNGRPSHLSRIFMKTFSQLPIVRCRIEPGEAYIAPTENLIHDGSSSGQSSNDRLLTIRGHVRLTKRRTEI